MRHDMDSRDAFSLEKGLAEARAIQAMGLVVGIECYDLAVPVSCGNAPHLEPPRSIEDVGHTSA